MNTGTIQTRKLQVIQYLASMHDERLLSQIELILNEAKLNHPSKKLTREELENRALRSMEDIRLGKTYSQEEVETNSLLW
jgi:hypothetical protein